MKSKKLIISFLIAQIILFGAAGKSQAIEYGMLGGKPANPDSKVENSASWFIYKLNPGEAKEDLLEVNNLFAESWKALIYAADTTPSSSGGFALKQFSEPKEEVGSWVKFYPDPLPEFFQGLFERKDKKILEVCRLSFEEIQDDFDIQNKKVKVKPKVEETQFQELEKWCAGVESVEKEMASKEKLFIPFVIRVPQEAEIGEHTGGVLIQKVEPETQQTNSGSSIKLTTRVGVRIYETVPGEIIKKLTLEDFKIIKNFKEFSFADWFGDPKNPQEYLIQSSVRNDGNVSIEQENIIHVKDLLFGKRNEDVSRKFQVLKKDSFISNYSWHNPRFGRFSFATEMKYQDAAGQAVAVVGPEIKIWVMPWREMAIAAALFLLVFAGYGAWRFYHKKKYGGIGWVPYNVEKGEDVVGIARQNNVNWKVLVKVNKLKAPYALEAGQMLLVPPDANALPGTTEEPAPVVEDQSPVDTEKLEKKVKSKLAKEKSTNDLVEEEASAGDEPPAEQPAKGKTEDVSLEEKGRGEEAVKELIAEEKIKAEGKKIKAEPVKKEEIFPTKAKKKKNKGEFIAKLAPKSGSTKERIEELEEKDYIWKKIGWILLGVIILAAMIGGTVLFLKNKKTKTIEIGEKLSTSPVGGEAESAPVPPPVELEKVAEPPAPNSSVSEKKAEVSLLVLNGGAAEGAAGKIKEALVGEGYSKTEAKNASASDHSGAAVYYKEDSLKETAEAVKELIGAQKIDALVKKASSAEQKSADVLVMLGK